MSTSSPASQVTVALDLLGGDEAPDAIVQAARLVLAEQADVRLVVVGPRALCATLLDAPGADARLDVVEAHRALPVQAEPARAARAGRGSSAHVAARLVRDGAADALVSLGPTGAVLSSAVLTLGRQRGVRRPPVTVVVPAARGPVVLLDAGGTVAATPEMLEQFAVIGAAYASAALGVPRPRVGLLSVGSERGRGDRLRQVVASRLSVLDLDFVGNVEGGDVCRGDRADVVVTDGFTGNVLLKGIESAVELARDRVVARGAADAPTADAVLRDLLPDAHEGAMLLGVNGVVVVGHGASTPQAAAGCVALAALAVRERVVPRVAGSIRPALERAQDRREVSG